MTEYILKMKTLRQAVSPALRFKDEQRNSYPSWEEKAFSCIAEKVNENCNPKNESKSLECIELESLSSNSGLLLRTFKSSDQKSTKTKFSAGDVLFGKLRPYLRKFYLADFEGVCTTEIWVLRPKSVPSEFLYYLVQSHQFNRVANIQSGTRMPRSDWRLVSRSKFKIPNDREELQKIGSFLSSVDRKIEQLIKKKELLEQYKKGMMQKFFSQEIRFKDKQGREYPEWVEKKLDQIADIVMGTSPKSSAYNNLKIGLPLIQGNADIKNGKSNPKIYTSEITKECLPNDILLGVKPFGKVSLSRHHACLGRGLAAIRANSKNSQEFIYYSLFWFEPKWKRLVQGSVHGGINTKDVKFFTLFIPSKSEQQKIGSFLSAIDRKIELVDQQIKLTQTFKKGLLQQMFV